MTEREKSPFLRRSSSEVAQLAGIKSAVEVLSAARLASSQDATTDRSSLLHSSSYTPPPKEKTRPRASTGKGTIGKGIRSFLKRSDTTSLPNSPADTQSDFFINDLSKKSLKDIKFDLLITQLQNAQPSWLSSFVNRKAGSLLLGHLTEANYNDSVKDKFLPCLRCFHTLVKRTEEANYGNLLDNDNFNNLIHILVWTQDLFLLSSTCMTLLDISQSLYGHLHLIESLSRTRNAFGYTYSTYPFICALKLLKPKESNSKGVRICSEVVLTLVNSLLMGIHDVKERFQCENELLAQGCLPLILDLREFGNLQGQLDLFEQILTNDNNEIANKVGKSKPITDNDTLKVKLCSTHNEQIIDVPFEPNNTMGDLVEIIAVKQEYLGNETFRVEDYGLFLPGDKADPDYVTVIGKIRLGNEITVSEYGLTSSNPIDFQLLPWNLIIKDTLHDNMEIHVTTNPTIATVADLLHSVVYKSSSEEESVPRCIVTSDVGETTYLASQEHGIYSVTDQNWLALGSKLKSLKEFHDRDNSEYLLAVKNPPLLIKFKDQSFNLELANNNITIQRIHDKVTRKLAIPEEQRSRYAMFIDDGNNTDDDPGRGMLELDKILDDILNEEDNNTITLSLRIQPRYLQVLISDDSLVDRYQPSSYNVLVLLNESVLEGIEAICKITGHNASEQQLALLNGSKLVDNQTFESQQIQEGTEVFLCKREEEEDEMANDVNIWEEERNENTFQTEIENGDTLVTAATLNQLVLKATDEDKYDSNFLETFLATYRSFTTPNMLLVKLMQRYNVPDDIADQAKKVVQMRVCVVMKRWVATFNDEEEMALLDKINQWIDSESRDGGGKVLSGIKSAIAKKSAAGSGTQFYFKSDPPNPIIPKEKTLEKITFNDLDPLELARQLTAVEFEMFSKIRPYELFGQPWSRPKLQHLCPNLMELINHFNFISRAVASIIVSFPKVRGRAKAYEKFIVMAEHLRNMNSFNLLVAVVSGMNNSGIGRLKWTKARVTQSHMKTLESLEELTSMQQSYKNYRNTIKENTQPPVIPYMGVYLQDLTFIEDGNPDQIGDLINFSKRILVRKILSQIATFQQEAYNFVIVPILRAYLENLPQLTDDDIYKQSLVIEPRSAIKSSDIE